MIFLLDTNVCIEVLRKRNAAIVARIARMPTDQIKICSVVMAELYVGALRSRAPDATSLQVQTFLDPFESFPFDDAAALQYARLRATLEAIGKPIGPYDLLIAAIALANGATLVSGNFAEFSRVPGLLIEDWS